MYTNYTVDDIIYMFRLMYIGDVRRVDFIQLEANDITNPLNNYQSAFIHMDGFYLTNVADNIQETVFTHNDHYKLWVGEGEFWWLMKTINPVADTRLNIHQVAENARLLEIKVADQEATINRQAEQLDRLQSVVDQVVSKIDELINVDSDKTFAAALDNLYYDGRSPDKYMWLTEDDEQEDDKSSTTYTDMPPLVDHSGLAVLNPDNITDDLSVSSNNSMPPLLNPADLNEDSDDSAQARINFSRDLCDNS
jgi:uncharacterized coiled-coil protein SlyX